MIMKFKVGDILKYCNGNISYHPHYAIFKIIKISKASWHTLKCIKSIGKLHRFQSKWYTVGEESEWGDLDSECWSLDINAMKLSKLKKVI